MRVENGMPADELPSAHWRKSSASNPSGSCVEMAELPGGIVALRNSRDASGPALVYPRAEVAAFLESVKGGEFDGLISLLPAAGTAIWGAHAETAWRHRGGVRCIVLCAPRRRMPSGLSGSSCLVPRAR